MPKYDKNAQPLFAILALGFINTLLRYSLILDIIAAWSSRYIFLRGISIKINMLVLKYLDRTASFKSGYSDSMNMRISSENSKLSRSLSLCLVYTMLFGRCK